MNQVTEEKKDAVTKSLAIVGFVAAILFAVWLAVQVVSIIPSAFSSLASLADSVYNTDGKNDVTFLVSNSTSVSNAGEATTISWIGIEETGTYSFMYDCTPGAALEVRVYGEMVSLDCDTEINLGNTSRTEVIADSEKQRFIDIPYTITFIPEVGNDFITTSSKVTVVNASIPTTGLVEENETIAGVETEIETEVEPEPEPEVAGETTTPTVPVVTPKPEVIEEIIYAIPVSDPNGTVDLAIKYLGVGILTNNKTFVPAGTIGQDQTGAFQFEVRNLGTKTSEAWSYEANLPSDIKHSSKDQNPLKPNERAVITIGFDGITETGAQTFGVTVETKSDTNSTNNSFVWAVTIVK